MARLTGTDAITYAALMGASISNYTTTIENASDNISIAAANEICRSDAGLVYVDTTEDGDALLTSFGIEEAHRRLVSFDHPQDWDTIEVVLNEARERVNRSK